MASVESGVTSDGLQTAELPAARAGASFHAKQKQRVVPRDDAADDPERVLDHQGELARLDRRDHPAGRVPADLRVVVERGCDPADLVGVLDQRLSALRGHERRELVGARAQPSGHLVEHVRALRSRRGFPGTESRPRGLNRSVHLL